MYPPGLLSAWDLDWMLLQEFIKGKVTFFFFFFKTRASGFVSKWISFSYNNNKSVSARVSALTTILNWVCQHNNRSRQWTFCDVKKGHGYLCQVRDQSTGFQPLLDSAYWEGSVLVPLNIVWHVNKEPVLVKRPGGCEQQAKYKVLW